MLATLRYLIIGAAVLYTQSAILMPCAFAYSGGDGSTANPYQIADVNDFMQLSATSTDWSKAFIMTADIVLDPNNNPAHVFTQSPIAPNTSTTLDFQGTQFTGSFDGNGHTISNLKINASSKHYIGLFGYVGTGGQLKNLGVRNANIQGSYYVGGLVGVNISGTVSSCYATGTASGTSFVGGLVGDNASGTITSCYATGAVNGTGKYVGGLVGYSTSGTITSCSATGAVNASSYAGGLVGDTYHDTITSCTATGAVNGTGSHVGGLVGRNYRCKVIHSFSTGKPTGTSSVGGLCGSKYTGTGYQDTGNFWDIESSGITNSSMGTGKTTAQMKTLSTFLSAGWDFSSADGDAADWCMSMDNYPQLRWQAQQVIEVPSVTGLSQSDAELAISSAGLVVGTITMTCHDTVPTGYVISQSLAAGLCVGPGYMLDLTISLGKPIVPDVLGLSQVDAQTAIIAANLTIGMITNAYHDSVPAGNVISQSPAAGSLANIGSAVNFTISLGRPVIPNVVGLSQADAYSAITTAGLVVGKITSILDNSVPIGNVINQSPPAGTSADVGSAVNLTISMPLQIGLNKTSYSFTANGKSNAVSPQTLTITNANADLLDWQIQVPADYNWLSVTPQSGQITDGNSIVTLAVDPNKANYGTNTAQLTVTAPNAANSPQTVTVYLTVNGPTMSVNTSSLSLYAAKDSAPVEKPFTITNTGYDTMHWSIDPIADCNWITAVTPSSGQCKRNEADTVTVTVTINPAGLDNGTYTKTLIIRTAELVTVRNVTVTLTIYTPNIIHVPTDYSTIDAAVNASTTKNGDIIIVHPGKYVGFSDRSKFLTLQSIDPNNPAIVASTIIETGINLYGTSAGAWTINGLSFIYNPVRANYSTASGISFSYDAIIKNCTIQNFPSSGIYSGGNYTIKHAKIINCVIAGNGYYAPSNTISANGGITVWSSGITDIENCLVANNGTVGICTPARTEFATINVTNCTIVDTLPGIDGKVVGIRMDGYNDIKLNINNSILSNCKSANDVEIAFNSVNQGETHVLNIANTCIPTGIGSIYVNEPNIMNLTYGPNIIELDPCFVQMSYKYDNNTPSNPNDDTWIAGDYHLKSAAGRWQPSDFVTMDATGDGIMDMSDFAVLAAEWQKTITPQWNSQYSYFSRPYLRADLDRNGIVDYNDLIVFYGNYTDYYDYGQWVQDDVNSPCIDAGDPNAAWSNELFPHGGRVNMGAFGNTPQASMSPDTSIGNPADVNNDGLVNYLDYSHFAGRVDDPSFPSPEDINRDGVVDFSDFLEICQSWLWSQ